MSGEAEGGDDDEVTVDEHDKAVICYSQEPGVTGLLFIHKADFINAVPPKQSRCVECLKLLQ